jgi:hypothetical protein
MTQYDPVATFIPVCNNSTCHFFNGAGFMVVLAEATQRSQHSFRDRVNEDLRVLQYTQSGQSTIAFEHNVGRRVRLYHA